MPRKRFPGRTSEELAAAGAGGSVASLPEGEGNLVEEGVSMETASDEQIERELIKEANTVDMAGENLPP